MVPKYHFRLSQKPELLCYLFGDPDDNLPVGPHGYDEDCDKVIVSLCTMERTEDGIPAQRLVCFDHPRDCLEIFQRPSAQPRGKMMRHDAWRPFEIGDSDAWVSHV